MVDQSLHLESIGEVPKDVNCGVRYAQLHRDIERGLESEKIWEELCRICLLTDRMGEAVYAFRKVTHPHLVETLAMMLAQKGVHVHGTANPVAPKEAPSPKATRSRNPSRGRKSMGRPVGTARVGTGQKTQVNGQGPLQSQPSPRLGGTSRKRVQVSPSQLEEPAETLKERVQDALQYLFLDSMPISLTLLTLAFPVAAAVGMLLPPVGLGPVDMVLKNLPFLAALLVLTKAASAIHQASIQGEEDPPRLFEGFPMNGLRVLGNSLFLVGLFLGPGAVSLLAGLPVSVWMSLGAGGLFLLPAAFLCLSMTGRLENVFSHRLLVVPFAKPSEYFQLSLTFLVGAGIPGLILAMLSGLPSYVGPALLGPLFVVPAIALARFSGHFIYANLADLQRAFGIESRPLRRVRRKAPSRPRVQSLPSWDREAAPRAGGVAAADRRIATPGPKPSHVTRRAATSRAEPKPQRQPKKQPGQPKKTQRRQQGQARRQKAKTALQAQQKGILGNHKHTPLR